MVKYFIALCVLFLTAPIQALTYEINDDSDIVGQVQYYTVQKGDTMHTIAKSYDLGMLEMTEANPKINPNKLKIGEQVLVPTEFILPPGPREGLVINLAELRAYYFIPGTNSVDTYPLGIGQAGWRTPIGETTIVRKRKNPSWTPPPSIHAEAAARGRSLPAVVPAGPNNPLGAYAVNLGWNGYLMHGTSAPASVGLRSSHGCMRMYAPDIESLFNHVEVGTKVRVIYEPYKIGVKDGELYLEAHELFPDNYYKIKHSDKFDLLQEKITTVNYEDPEDIDWDNAKVLIKQTNGYPVNISEKAG